MSAPLTRQQRLPGAAAQWGLVALVALLVEQAPAAAAAANATAAAATAAETPPLFGSCEPNIFQVVGQDPELSWARQFAINSEADTIMQTNAPALPNGHLFTFFVPENGALAAGLARYTGAPFDAATVGRARVPDGAAARWSSGPELAAAYYFSLVGGYDADALVALGAANTMLGLSRRADYTLSFSRDAGDGALLVAGRVPGNVARVLRSVRACNGWLHVVDAALVPAPRADAPGGGDLSLEEAAAGRAAIAAAAAPCAAGALPAAARAEAASALLQDYWDASGLAAALGDPAASVTVMVPSDGVVEAAVPGRLAAAGLARDEGLRQATLFGMLPGLHCPAELAAAGEAQTVLGLVDGRDDARARFRRDANGTLFVEGAGTAAAVLRVVRVCRSELWVLDAVPLPPPRAGAGAVPARLPAPPDRQLVCAPAPEVTAAWGDGEVAGAEAGAGGGGGGLSAGAAAGIAVGCAAAAAAAAGAALWLRRSRRAGAGGDEESSGGGSRSGSGSGSRAAAAPARAWSSPALAGGDGLPPEAELLLPPGSVAIARRPDGAPWLVGAGSFGRVYRGTRGGVQPVAVKTFGDGDGGRLDARALAAVRREVRMMKFLSRDPSVVQFLGMVQDGGAPLGGPPGARLAGGGPMLVFEFMDGGDLRSALSADADAPPAERRLGWWRGGRGVALDVARALSFLAANGAVHRDVKSRNVLLTAHGRAKLADVGLATLGDGAASSLTWGGGTFAFAAPELLLGERVTPAADVFSFGVLLWEVVTGELPTRGHMRPPAVPAECPPEVAALVEACMAREPGRRPAPRALFDALAAAPGGPEGGAPPAGGAPPPAAAPPPLQLPPAAPLPPASPPAQGAPTATVALENPFAVAAGKHRGAAAAAPRPARP